MSENTVSLGRAYARGRHHGSRDGETVPAGDSRVVFAERDIGGGRARRQEDRTPSHEALDARIDTTGARKNKRRRTRFAFRHLVTFDPEAAEHDKAPLAA